MARQRRLNQKRGWAFGFAVLVVKPVLVALTKQDWSGGMNIPATGGCVVAVNHLSHADPLTLAHFLYDHGRIVRYLTKQELFEVPVVGRVAADAGQIPVARASHDALHSFDAAVRAVEQGELVAFYPEGTITRDPDLWPMRGKLGAARVALQTGCPVIPMGHWGVQELLPPYGRPHPLPRKTIRVRAGDPVPLDDLRATVEAAGGVPSREVLAEATERILTAITAIVAELRGEEPPAERFDPRKAGVRSFGNPNKHSPDPEPGQ